MPRACSVRHARLRGKEQREGVMALRTANGGAVPPDLLTLADGFQQLQDAGHRADYDGNYDPVRAVTLNHVDDSETALKSAWRLWRAGNQQDPARQETNRAYRLFLRLALLRSGGPSAR